MTSIIKRLRATLDIFWGQYVSLADHPQYRNDSILHRRAYRVLVFIAIVSSTLLFTAAVKVWALGIDRGMSNIVAAVLVQIPTLLISRGYLWLPSHILIGLAIGLVTLNSSTDSAVQPYFHGFFAILPPMAIFLVGHKYAYIYMPLIFFLNYDLLDADFFFLQEGFFSEYRPQFGHIVQVSICPVCTMGLAHIFDRGEVLALDEMDLAQDELNKEMYVRKTAEEGAYAASKAKSEFLAVMSHEIRTPLNGILGTAQILRNSPLGPEEAECVATIDACGQSLLVVLNDILDLSKIEAGRLVVENIPFELRKTIERVVHLQYGAAEEKGLRIKLNLAPELPNWVLGDPARLSQVILNLTSNAVKFTEVGTIEVKVSNRDNRICFTVRDTGIGISTEALSRLFQPFEQAEASTSRRFGGTGLGLSISQRLVGLMGGTLSVESQVGVGSVFMFDLSLPVTEDRQVTEKNTTSLTPPVLTLVVDDNRVNQRVAQKLLEKQGFRALCASSGMEGLELLDKYPEIELVLMDIQMPELDGRETTRRIRASSKYPKLHIVGLSAGAMAEEKQMSIDAGMNAYLSKPFKVHEIIDIWRELTAKTI